MYLYLYDKYSNEYLFKDFNIGSNIQFPCTYIYINFDSTMKTKSL